MSTPLTDALPGYTTGTWAIDPVHSEVSFTVRHLGIAKTRGRFDTFEGEIVTTEDPLKSSVTATIQAASFDSANEMRDDHVRSEEFLHVEAFPTITFTSTGVRSEDDGLLLDGELTVRGVTKPVTLELELNGFGSGMDGKPAVGFTASTTIKRKDFGVEGGAASAAVSDTVWITIDVEAHQQ